LSLWAVVVLALVLRLVRAAMRWDEIALAYVAYPQSWWDAAGRFDLWGMLNFTGLHPPFHSLLLGAVDWVWGAPAGWLLFSVLCSTLAVWVVGRMGGASAAAVLAVGPLQLAYCAEVNDYPLLVLTIACCLWGRALLLRGRGATVLVLAGIFAGWTHMLGGALAVAAALSVWGFDRRLSLRTAGYVVLGCLPVIWRGVGLALEAGSYGQAGLELAGLVNGLTVKVGYWWLVVPFVILGAWKQKGIGLLLVALTGLILFMIFAGVAAPHQHPYWLVLGPPAALLVSALSRRLAWVVSAFGLLLFIPVERDAISELRSGLERERAVDLVLREAAAEDAVWLLAPALKPDDDKTDYSDVLWRYSPWKSAPAWRGPQHPEVGFEFADYRYGQPRLFEGRVTHQTTDMDLEITAEVIDWHLAAGRKVWFVLYDHGPANDYPGLMAQALAPFTSRCEWVGRDTGLGVDQFCVVEARR